MTSITLNLDWPAFPRERIWWSVFMVRSVAHGINWASDVKHIHTKICRPMNQTAAFFHTLSKSRSEGNLSKDLPCPIARSFDGSGIQTAIPEHPSGYLETHIQIKIRCNHPRFGDCAIWIVAESRHNHRLFADNVDRR